MSEALTKIEKSLNQKFDCGIVMEVLNNDLTTKTLTVLVNSKDKWDTNNLFGSLEYVRSKLKDVAIADLSAIGFKSSGFKMVKDGYDNVVFEKFIEWSPQYISRKVNQG